MSPGSSLSGLQPSHGTATIEKRHALASYSTAQDVETFLGIGPDLLYFSPGFFYMARVKLVFSVSLPQAIIFLVFALCQPLESKLVKHRLCGIESVSSMTGYTNG